MQISNRTPSCNSGYNIQNNYYCKVQTNLSCSLCGSPRKNYCVPVAYKTKSHLIRFLKSPLHVWSSIYIIFIVAGAWVFQTLEKPKEYTERLKSHAYQVYFLRQYQCMTTQAMTELSNRLIHAFHMGIRMAPIDNLSEYDSITFTDGWYTDFDSPKFQSLREDLERIARPLLKEKEARESSWNLIESIFFSSSVVTTIGYGNTSPVTVLGKIFCIIYACIGVPFHTLLASALVATFMPAIRYTRDNLFEPFIRLTIKEPSYDSDDYDDDGDDDDVGDIKKDQCQSTFVDGIGGGAGAGGAGSAVSIPITAAASGAAEFPTVKPDHLATPDGNAPIVESRPKLSKYDRRISNDPKLFYQLNDQDVTQPKTRLSELRRFSGETHNERVSVRASRYNHQLTKTVLNNWLRPPPPRSSKLIRKRHSALQTSAGYLSPTSSVTYSCAEDPKPRDDMKSLSRSCPDLRHSALERSMMVNPSIVRFPEDRKLSTILGPSTPQLPSTISSSLTSLKSRDDSFITVTRDNSITLPRRFNVKRSIWFKPVPLPEEDENEAERENQVASIEPLSEKQDEVKIEEGVDKVVPGRNSPRGLTFLERAHLFLVKSDLFFTTGTSWSTIKFRRTRSHLFMIRMGHFILVVLLITTIVIFVPAMWFYMAESDWSYFDAVYFCVISCSTIGLGDFVPSSGDYSPTTTMSPGLLPSWKIYRLCVTIYMFIGTLLPLIALRCFYEVMDPELLAAVLEEQETIYPEF